MNRRRFLSVFLVGAAMATVFVEPALAQTSDSVTENLIWDLNLNLLYIAVPITVLVEGILIYTVVRFRNNEEPLPTRENRRLEITWTIATAIILLVVGVGSYQVLASDYVGGTGEAITEGDAEPLVVEVEAQRYGWTFYYEGIRANTSQPAGEDNTLSSGGTLHLPTDRPIKLRVVSTDWLHSFHVPDLGLKQDAFPGQHNTIWTSINEPGEYQLYCAEYCGVGHAGMLGTVDVTTSEGFQEWVESQQSS